MALGQNVCLDESSDEFGMGHVWSKTRSLGQTLEKVYVRSKGHIFSPIIMKLSQNFSLMKTRTSLKMGHVGKKKKKKTKSLGKILEKTLCTL